MFINYLYKRIVNLKKRGLIEVFKIIIRKIKNNRKNNPDEIKIAFESINASSINGVMIDVGAHYGESMSIFLEQNWKILAFEPDSLNRLILNKNHKDSDNVFIDNRALSDHKESKAVLFRSKESSGISGLSAFTNEHKFGEEVDVTTIEDAISDYDDIKNIDFLKIDTEGYDLFVIKGFPWNKIKPRLILCEFEDRKTVPLGYTFYDLANFLESKGYRVIISEWYPIKQYGVSHTWRRFSTYPCKLEDSQDWGNIFATNEKNIYENLLKKCNIKE